MKVINKWYEAVFYQNHVITDSIAMANELKEILLQKYSEKELENPTEDIKTDITKMGVSYAMDLISKKPVWFIISDFYGKYYITMFYDNEYNRANGEDL